MLFSKITTLQIGGPIGKFIEAETETELISALKEATRSNLEFLIIGGGSNLLVSDEGFNGLVIKNSLTGIIQEGRTLKVKSGTILQDLVDFANSKGLSGLQKLTGIPGTVGGAVYGNAGAYGQTISDHISSVTILDPASPEKDLKTLTKNECKFNYRGSIFKESKNIIIEVTFELEKENPETLKTESSEILEKRLLKYPKGIKCPGSFFKNIVAGELPQDILARVPQDMIVYGKIPAGILLEAVGAKGDSLDGIEIAPYHANLFINKGGGTAKDFYELASKYVKLVKEKFGISLKPEVQLINLPSLD